MNAEAELGGGSRNSLDHIWLCAIRIVLVLAWTFNLVNLGAGVSSAWNGEDSSRVLGVGFLFLWLLMMGVVVVRTSVAAPEKASKTPRS
jgi:hypothetical protein